MPRGGSTTVETSFPQMTKACVKLEKLTSSALGAERVVLYNFSLIFIDWHGSPRMTKIQLPATGGYRQVGCELSTLFLFEITRLI